MELNQKNKSILLLVYALVMFLTIESQVDTTTFILLFAVVPVVIYLFVKRIFPRK